MSTLQGLYFEPLVNHFQPGKLADLSAVSFVAGLTHKNLEQMRLNSNMKTDHYSSPKLKDIGSIPRTVGSTLDKLISPTKKSWSEWWIHHHEKVFFQRQPADNLIDLFDLLVWLPDATINYEQTARKMVNSDRLTNVQKFQLACAYCFIKDVERLKQTLTNAEMEEATDGRRKFPDEFFNYWSRKMHLKRTIGYEILLDELTLSLEYDDRTNYNIKPYDEWPAIKYFLNRMRSRRRPSKFKDLIKFGGPRLTWLLLPTLSDAELYLIFEQNGFRIMKTLLKNRVYFDFALSVWKQMVNIIDNVETGRIIYHVHYLKFERNCVNDLVWRMWLVTSERQKNYIADERICYFVENSLHRKHNDYYTPNFPLIVDVLSRSTPERRKFYWESFWEYLVIGQLSHRAYIEHIMKLCFDNDQQIEDFKKTTMLDYESISKYCNTLLKKERIKDVQTYLEFCTSDPQIIRNMKKTIIKKLSRNDLLKIFLYRRSEETLADFNRYLEDVFSETQRKKFFNKMATSRSNLKKIRNMLGFEANVQDVIRFIETFASSEENLAKAKLKFFELYCDCMDDLFLPSCQRLDLMAWCFNGDKILLDNFKTIIFSKNEKIHRKRIRLEVEVPEVPSRDVFEVFARTYKRCEL